MSITQHPLTHEQAVTLWNSTKPPCAWESVWNLNGVQLGLPHPLLAPLRAAFDAGREHERTTPAAEDDRPWEPLNAGDPVRVGDEVRQDLSGITHTAVVGCVDGEGDPWAAEDRFIGRLDSGTWYVRRAVQELPTEDGAVIVPADGHDYIETRAGKKSRRLTWDAECYVWYDARGTHLASDINPGTWKVDDR